MGTVKVGLHLPLLSYSRTRISEDKWAYIHVDFCITQQANRQCRMVIAVMRLAVGEAGKTAKRTSCHDAMMISPLYVCAGSQCETN